MKYQSAWYISLSLMISCFIQTQADMSSVPTRGMLGYWYSLSNNTKLAIECALALLALYVLMYIFGCKTCVHSCSCDKMYCRSVGCKGEDLMMTDIKNYLCPCGCGCSEESCKQGGCGCSSCSCASCK